MNVVEVADEGALAALCERIERVPRVAIDTEFHSEKTYTPRLMLVQIAFDDEAALVDPLAIADLHPLARALQGRTIVGHALSSDLKIFYERFATLPTDLFDTQVAAAFCGYGLSISLLDLVRDVTGVMLHKSQTVSDWSVRPLSARQIDYLVDDVRYLLRLQDDLHIRLEASGRLQWAKDESALLLEDRRYAVDRERLYTRVAGAQKLSRRELAILSELAVLRESVARERDIPLKTVIADDLLIGLAALKPQTSSQLDELRRLTVPLKRSLGARILAAVASGENWAEDRLPKKGGKPLGAAREACVSLLGVMVDGIAAAAGLPSSLLVPRAALDRALREHPRTLDELVHVLDLTSWRTNLVAEPLWALLCGLSQVRIEDYLAGTPHPALNKNGAAEKAEQPSAAKKATS